MIVRRWLGALTLCALGILGAAVARAVTLSPMPSAPVLPAMRAQAASVPLHELSREQALALVQRRYAARVLRADVLDRDGRRLYVFRLLSAAGQVWTVRVDAVSGAEVP